MWGSGLFSDDVACDIRDHYRQLLEDGAEDGAATQLTLEKFEPYLEESDSIALIAFAVTQSKLGRLEPDVRVGSLGEDKRKRDDTWREPSLLNDCSSVRIKEA